METFDTETIEVLPVLLPPQLELGYCSVAFILSLLTAGMQMAHWKIDVNREFRVSVTGERIWSNQQPILVGSMARIAYKGGDYILSGDIVIV